MSRELRDILSSGEVTDIRLGGTTDNERLLTNSEIQAELANKADLTHPHIISDVTGLEEALAGKQKGLEVNTTGTLVNSQYLHVATVSDNTVMSIKGSMSSAYHHPAFTLDLYYVHSDLKYDFILTHYATAAGSQFDQLIVTQASIGAPIDVYLRLANVDPIEDSFSLNLTASYSSTTTSNALHGVVVDTIGTTEYVVNIPTKDFRSTNISPQATDNIVVSSPIDESITGSGDVQSKLNIENKDKLLFHGEYLNTNREAMLHVADAAIIITQDTPITPGTTAVKWDFIIEQPSTNVELLDADAANNTVRFKRPGVKYGWDTVGTVSNPLAGAAKIYTRVVKVDSGDTIAEREVTVPGNVHNYDMISGILFWENDGYDTDVQILVWSDSSAVTIETATSYVSSQTPSTHADTMHWAGAYDATITPPKRYYRNDVVRDNEWLSICIADDQGTIDRPAPQHGNDPVFVIDAVEGLPTWEEVTLTDTPVVDTGHDFKVVTAGWLHAVSAYLINDPTLEHTIALGIVNFDGTFMPLLRQTIDNATIPADGWYMLHLDTPIGFFDGMVVGCDVITRSKDTLTEKVTGQWYFQGTLPDGQNPGAGYWSINSGHTILKISGTTPFDGDKDLSVIQVDDLIRFNQDAVEWEFKVTGVYTPSNNVYTFDVEAVRNDGTMTTNQITDITAYYYGTGSTVKYVREINGLSNIDNITGVITTPDLGPYDPSNDRHATDFYFEPAVQSPDWEVITFVNMFGGSSGGSSTGAQNFLELLDTPTSYTGNAEKMLSVNIDENKIEFVDKQWFDTVDTNGQGALQAKSGIRTVQIFENGYGFTGLYLNNINDVDNYAGSFIGVKSGAVDYEDQVYLAFTGKNYYRKEHAGNAVLATDKALYIGSGQGHDTNNLPNQEPIVFQVSQSYYDSGGYRYFDPITVFTMSPGGLLSSNTPAYETFLVDDNDIPNKKYVDDSLLTKEDSLGNPTTDGQYLTSLVDGTRSWTSLPIATASNGLSLVGNDVQLGGSKVSKYTTIGQTLDTNLVFQGDYTAKGERFTVTFYTGNDTTPNGPSLRFDIIENGYMDVVNFLMNMEGASLVYRQSGIVLKGAVANGGTGSTLSGNANDWKLQSHPDGNEPLAVSSVQYVKDTVAGAVDTTMKSPDSHDASTGLLPTDYKGTGVVSEGDTFYITVEGIIQGFELQVGDLIVAKIDNPGQDVDNWFALTGTKDQATEQFLGQVKISDQATTDAGVDDQTAVTPLKLNNYSKWATYYTKQELGTAGQAAVDWGNITNYNYWEWEIYFPDLNSVAEILINADGTIDSVVLGAKATAIEYSTDDGATWTTWNDTPLTVTANDFVKWRLSALSGTYTDASVIIYGTKTI